MIRMEGVNKYFADSHAWRDINPEIPVGQVVVVLSSSGSGKSPLCRTINRLETIASGTIDVDGVPLPEEGNELARRRADVGLVSQQFNRFPHLTIRGNITLGPNRVRRMKKAATVARAIALPERVGSASQADKPRAACWWTAAAGGDRPRTGFSGQDPVPLTLPFPAFPIPPRKDFPCPPLRFVFALS